MIILNWEDFFLKLAIELGGFTGVIFLLIKKLGNAFIKIISENYESILQKEFEKYKDNLERKSYAGKAKFDTILAGYSQISSKFIECFDIIATITPNGKTEITNNIKEISEIEKIINDFQECLNSNIFIFPKNIYNSFQKILDLFYKQIAAFKALISSDENEEIDCISLEELESMREKIIDFLHESFASLEVL